MTSTSTSSAEVPLSDTVATPPRQWELERLPRQRPPLLERKRLLHGEFPAPGQVKVLMSQVALATVEQHGTSDLGTELGGVLLGHAYHYEGQLFVEVVAALPAVSGDRGPVHFTFTADAWSQIHHDRDHHYPELNIVGWFHTHPDLAVFFSVDDVVVHTAAFVLPWHVALVVDPIRDEMAYFGWQEEKIEPLTGFFEVLDRQPTPQTTWRGVQTIVGQPRPQPQPREPGSRSVYMPPSGWPALAAKQWLMPVLAVSGMLLLLVWLLLLTRRVNQLQDVSLALAGELAQVHNAAGNANCPDPRLQIVAPAAGNDLVAGQTISVIGTASHPQAYRYLVELHPENMAGWIMLGTTRRDQALGQLANWDTALYDPGIYELRLSAVNRENLPIVNNPAPAPNLAESGEEVNQPPQMAACIIRLQLVGNDS